MDERIIEIEAESLDEARIKARDQIPEGLRILSEEIVSDGEPITLKISGDTTEAAFTKAQSAISDNADILDKKELSAPRHAVVRITVEAFDQQSAISDAEWQAKEQGQAGTVQSVKLTVPGRKGFLGIGAKPNQYAIELLVPQPAVVEVIYKAKAKIAVRLAEALKWGREPPDLLVLILDREPPAGRLTYNSQLIATFPKDSIPATVVATIEQAYLPITVESYIRHYAISAANTEGILPDMERITWQEVPPLSEVKGIMVAVYEKKDLVKNLSGNISSKKHDFHDSSVQSASLCLSDAEEADQFYKDFIAWSRSNRPPVPVTVCRINSSGVRYPCFVTRFTSSMADYSAEGKWFYRFYQHQDEEGKLPLGQDFASMPARNLFRENPVVAIEGIYIEPSEPSATDT